MTCERHNQTRDNTVTSEPHPVVEQVSLAVRAGDLESAINQAEAALARGVEHPLLLNLRAYRLEGQGRLTEALAALERARELAPGDPSVLNALGLCLARLDRMAPALQAFDAAVAIQPGFVQAHANKGRAYEALGLLDKAAESFGEAARLAPDAPDPVVALAGLAARRGDAGQTRTLALGGLKLQDGHPGAVIALAQAEIIEGRFNDAAARLGRVLQNRTLPPADRAFAQSLLGDALDGIGRAAEAFAAYRAANGEYRNIHAQRFAGWSNQSAREMVDWLGDYFRAADPALWAEAPAPGEAPVQTHVFLVGFPRSGTTLLEQALASHPRVQSLEEVEVLADGVRDFMRDPAALDRLAALTPAEAERYRAAYWDAVRVSGLSLQGGVLLDKLPLNTVKLALIAKLFPRAKILFAVRDPRDVVFSCFRRRFRMNASMFEFLTLEGAARFYASVMGLAEAYRARLPLDLHTVRYEALVEDFEGEVRAVADFLGLDWNEAMAGFAARGAARAVATPSASQVARGLYKEGVGQWRPYRGELASIMPVLHPWIERFGYQPD